MLLRRATLSGIRDGRISLQFRRWKRPTVKEGGTLLTAIGQLAIDAVEAVEWDEVTDDDARAAGFEGREALEAALGAAKAGTSLYRVRLRLAGPDPRMALREEIPTEEELRSVLERMERWDGASPVGPWTLATLNAIAERPAVRAGDLASALGLEKARFKTNVRKLKGLGLTESLEIGYRLSPRGKAVLRRLRG